MLSGEGLYIREDGQRGSDLDEVRREMGCCQRRGIWITVLVVVCLSGGAGVFIENVFETMFEENSGF